MNNDTFDYAGKRENSLYLVIFRSFRCGGEMSEDIEIKNTEFKEKRKWFIICANISVIRMPMGQTPITSQVKL